MGVRYTLSLFVSMRMFELAGEAYLPFVVLAPLTLPFSRKRAICDHHRPTIWNAARYFRGCPSRCPGGCVLSTHYGLDDFLDDLRWSVYFVERGVWFYLSFSAWSS